MDCRSQAERGHVAQTTEKWSSYHLMSLVETKLHCFKCLGGRQSSVGVPNQAHAF